MDYEVKLELEEERSYGLHNHMERKMHDGEGDCEVSYLTMTQEDSMGGGIWTKDSP